MAFDRMDCNSCFARKTIFTLIVAASLILAAGCRPSYDTGRETADAWLSTLAATATCTVSGSWIGPGTGYGIMGQQPFGSLTLIQEGSRLRGQMPDYELVGTVAGRRATLVGLHGGKVYYTFHLELADSLSPRVLMGHLCNGYRPELDENCHAIQLREAGKR